MRITLTTRQARAMLTALEWAKNPDFPDSDSLNAMYIRIENKIRKELK